MSNLGIAGFEKYHDNNKFDSPTSQSLEAYFEEMFYHKPSKEQLELFYKYLIGVETDAEKVIDFCSSKKIENQPQI